MKFLLSTYFVFIVLNSFSQLYVDGEVTHYTLEENKDIYYLVDTSLLNFEEYNHEHQNGWELFNLGIIGSAEQNIDFKWNFQKGFQDGNIFFNNYKYKIDKLKYYNTSKFPYSELSYSLGSRFEQIAKLIHAQNIKNRFNFAFDAKGISGSGIYDDPQKTRNIALAFYGIYDSKNKNYQAEFDITYSTIKTNEIGGVVEDVLTDIQTNKLFYSTYLTDATTEQTELSVLIKNSYSLGIEKLDSISDSLNVKSFFPIFKIKHSIGTNIVKNSFKDFTIDSLFWGDFVQNSDSLSNVIKYHNIPHRISLAYLGTNNEDSITYRNIQAEIGLQHNNIEIWHNSRELTTNNFMLDAKIQSNKLSNSKLSYAFNSHFIFTGYNQFDFHTGGEIAFDFKKFGIIKFSTLYESISPSWIENNYNSISKNWDNHFDKKQIFESKIQYKLKKHKLLVEVKLNLLNNFIYFNKNSTPIQTNANITYWNISVQKNSKWKIWHWNNFIGFQNTNYQNIIPVPQLFLKTSFFAEFKTFKSNLLLSTGFDLRYNTDFQARAWNPLISQFHLQDVQTMSFTPMIDVFLNAKIKSVRIYAKLNYANEGLFVNNNYKALNYPTNGRTFSFGGSWRFFE